jgi:ABC-2 type transport system permease protein
MRLYLEFLKNKFKSNFAYRVDLYMRIFYKIIILFIQIPLWRAVLETEKDIDNMATYVIISTLISSIIGNGVIGKIDFKIKTGEFATDLIKPMNFFGYIFFDSLGDNIFRLLFEMIPVFFVGFIVFDFKVPNNLAILVFILSTILGYIINFLLGFTLGLISFWYLSVWHLSRLLEDVVKLFGGSLIPLWYFPSLLVIISKYLPFQYIYYIPISIYLKQYDIGKTVNLLLIQTIWCIILSILLFGVWKLGRKKLVIQGG